MRRNTIMTLGFVLILIGIQFNVVQSYELTPRFSNFLSENGGTFKQNSESVQATNNQGFNSPYYQASYSNAAADPATQKFIPAPLQVINIPNWVCWPVLFFGAVLFLHGLAKRD